MAELEDLEKSGRMVQIGRGTYKRIALVRTKTYNIKQERGVILWQLKQQIYTQE